MKLINYHYGYMFHCTIRGKITVNQKEWKEIKKYLCKSPSRYFEKEDFTNSIQDRKGLLYNIRVRATALVAVKYGMKKYKDVNYVFLVLDEKKKR